MSDISSSDGEHFVSSGEEDLECNLMSVARDRQACFVMSAQITVRATRYATKFNWLNADEWFGSTETNRFQQ